MPGAHHAAVLPGHVRQLLPRERTRLTRLGRFLVVGATGVLVSHLGVYYLVANLLGISLAMVWNFAVNCRWTWGGVQ